MQPAKLVLASSSPGADDAENAQHHIDQVLFATDLSNQHANPRASFFSRAPRCIQAVVTRGSTEYVKNKSGSPLWDRIREKINRKFAGTECVADCDAAAALHAGTIADLSVAGDAGKIFVGDQASVTLMKAVDVVASGKTKQEENANDETFEVVEEYACLKKAAHEFFEKTEKEIKLAGFKV